MADVKTVRLVNSETDSVVVVDEETAARMGPEWGPEKSTKRAKPSAERNTFGVAKNAVPVESQVEPKPNPKK